jgi:hypothetical protein
MSNSKFKLNTAGWLHSLRNAGTISRFGYCNAGFLDDYDVFGKTGRGNFGWNTICGSTWNETAFSVTVDPAMSCVASVPAGPFMVE